VSEIADGSSRGIDRSVARHLMPLYRIAGALMAPSTINKGVE
jgi:hypothetical protein